MGDAHEAKPYGCPAFFIGETDVGEPLWRGEAWGSGSRTVLPPIAPYGVRLTALSGDKTYRRCSRARRFASPCGFLKQA